jgi:hypothetical protein
MIQGSGVEGIDLAFGARLRLSRQSVYELSTSRCDGNSRQIAMVGTVG